MNAKGDLYVRFTAHYTSAMSRTPLVAYTKGQRFFSDHVMSYLFKRKCRGGIPMFANVNAKIIKMVVSLFVRLWSLKCFL